MHRFAQLLVTIGFCAFGVFASSASAMSVVFINPGDTTQFWGDVSKTMQAAAEDLGIDLEIIHTHRDRLAMVAAASELAARSEHPDYVILVNELQQAPPMLAALRAANIPVFELLNRMTDAQRQEFVNQGGDVGNIIGSIVPDNEVAGYEMATSIFEAARTAGLDSEGIQLLALLGDAATPAALAREAGLKRALDENPDVTLVRSFPVMWDQQTAYERTRLTLGRHEVDAVWAANDQISIGAQDAAAEVGETPGETIVFAGLNWSNEGLEAVRNGSMTMTHGGHFFAGAWSMVILTDLHEGSLETGQHVEFPMSAVTADSVDLFLEYFGDRDWRGVDFTSFRIERQDSGSYDFSATAILAATPPADVKSKKAMKY